MVTHLFVFFFFFNDTATTEIYTLSLHDALPIWMESNAARSKPPKWVVMNLKDCVTELAANSGGRCCPCRSEEHTSELQSPCNLVCRLLLEKKKTINHTPSQYSLHRHT